MGKFPYPVQYFFCNAWDMEQKTLDDMVRLFMNYSIASGPVSGETGIEGLKLDFKSGLRLQIPAGNWHVVIGDHDSGIVFFDEDVSERILFSIEKYYIRWQIEIFRDGEPVFAHIFDPTGQKIALVFVSGLIGDTLSFLPYIPVVRERYQAEVYVYINEKMSEICRRLLPDVRQGKEIEEDTYATFYFSAGMNLWGWMPIDGRLIPMTQTGQIILGLPEPAPKLPWPSGPRQIAEPYVCIGVQASSDGKGWHYPGGWEEVTAYLKSLGYRVLCIDRDKKYKSKQSRFSMKMPKGAENFTGNRPLMERADMLAHAEFFIGLGSGLSWLAYTVNCPVILIGGFSVYWTEFPTPYRVFNRLVCNGCYNDLGADWENNACPRQKNGTKDYLKCSTTITPRMVMQTIDRLIRDRKEGRI